MDEWARLALTLQRDMDGELSRLTVATVIAEVRRDLRQCGDEESLELVARLAGERLWAMLEQRRQSAEAYRPAGLHRRMG